MLQRDPDHPAGSEDVHGHAPHLPPPPHPPPHCPGTIEIKQRREAGLTVSYCTLYNVIRTERGQSTETRERESTGN